MILERLLDFIPEIHSPFLRPQKQLLELLLPMAPAILQTKSLLIHQDLVVRPGLAVRHQSRLRLAVHPTIEE